MAPGPTQPELSLLGRGSSLAVGIADWLGLGGERLGQLPVALAGAGAIHAGGSRRGTIGRPLVVIAEGEPPLLHQGEGPWEMVEPLLHLLQTLLEPAVRARPIAPQLAEVRLRASQQFAEDRRR